MIGHDAIHQITEGARVAAALAHFETHFAGADEGHGLLFGLKPEKWSRSYNLAKPDALQRMAQDAAEMAKRADVYFNVNILRHAMPSPERGAVDAGHFSAVTAFVLDADIRPCQADKPQTTREVEEFFNDLALPPSYVVWSGSGAHAYWFFREPIPVTDPQDLEDVRSQSVYWARLVKRRAAERGWKLDSVADLARILRPIGTFNWKPVAKGGDPLLVTLGKDTGRRYLLSDFDDVLPGDIADEDRGEAVAPKPGQIILTPEERLAIVEQVLPHCGDGRRHDIAKFVSGWLAINGITEASTLELIVELSTNAGDRDQVEKIKTASNAYRRLAKGQRPLGWNALKEFVAAERLSRLDTTLKAARERCYVDGLLATIGNVKQAQGPSRPETDRGEPIIPRPLTDLGNAERLASRYARDVRYSPDLGTWIVWEQEPPVTEDNSIDPPNPTSGRWQRDDTGTRVRRLAQLTVRAIFDEAKTIEDDDKRQRVAKHALASERSQRLAAMVREAEVLDTVRVDLNQLDDDAGLLNCRNGTVDLRTGILRPPRREDFITRMVPAEYLPDALRPTFDSFLDGVFRRVNEVDTQTRDYVQRLIGYAATGDPVERVLPIFHGSGANGKSTLVETIMHTLGPGYAAAVEPDLIYTKRGDDNRRQQQIAALRGVRFAPAAEGGEDQRIDSPMVKRLTGRDTLTGRELYRKAFTFPPTHSVFLTTNHRPKVTDSTKSIWDRLRLIPFLTPFLRPDEPGYDSAPEWRRVDPRLPEKLERERVGILAWIVEGAVAYYEHGLPTPKTVIETTKEYRTAEDDAGRFIADMCIEDPGGLVVFGQLYGAYLEWHEAMNDGDPMSEKVLGRRLTEKGFGTTTARQNGKKVRVRGGLRLRDAPVTVPLELDNDHPLGTNGTVMTTGTETGGEFGNSTHEEPYSEELPNSPPVTVPARNGSTATVDDIPFPRDAA